MRRRKTIPPNANLTEFVRAIGLSTILSMIGLCIHLRTFACLVLESSFGLNPVGVESRTALQVAGMFVAGGWLLQRRDARLWPFSGLCEAVGKSPGVSRTVCLLQRIVSEILWPAVIVCVLLLLLGTLGGLILGRVLMPLLLSVAD